MTDFSPMTAETAIVAVVGPTACGKSDIGHFLAERLGGEIVSVDSVQVYRGMDIGSAKARPSTRGAVRYHMVDVLDPWEECSAGWYRQKARAVIEEIAARKKPVILVGGSPLYYFSLTTDLPLYSSSPELRRKLENDMARKGLEYLAESLRKTAPAVYASIDTANPRRVIRALEIAQMRQRQGLGADGWYEGLERYCNSGLPLIGVGISVPGRALRRRIQARTTRMLEEGLVEEVRWLHDESHPPPAASAALAIGYRQVHECLSSDLGTERMQEAVSTATWKLVRRQKAWFRRDPRICWFSSEEPVGLVGAIEKFIFRKMRSQSLGIEKDFAATAENLEAVVA